MTMPDRRAPVVPFTAIFLLATFCLAVFDITEHDYWWHLATGKYIIEHRLVPRSDVFSYTATLPWVAHYWLADVVGYALYRVFGTPGMILMNASVITFSFWLVLLAARAAGGGRIIATAVTLVAVFASRSRFYVRPETCSFLLTALYLFIFSRWKGGRGGNRLLLLFPPLQLLWANLYGGGSVVGLVLLFCFTLGEALNTLCPPGAAPRRSPRDAARLAVSALAAFAFAFVNPNTHRVVFYFLMSRDPIFRLIVEWRRMDASDIFGVHGALLAAGAALLVCSRKRTDFTDLALFLALGAMSVDAPRSLPFFAMVSVPIIAPRLRRALSPWASREGVRASWKRNGAWIQLAAACAAVAFTVWFLFRDTGHFSRDYAFGLGVNWKLFPVQAVDFVERNRVEGPIFNSYGIGGYLIWRLYPRTRVFVDGRVEMYGTGFLKTYMLYWQPEVWEWYVGNYGITCAVIDREPNYTTRYLDENPGWALVFFDDRAMVYLRNTPQNEDLIRRHRYRFIRPGDPKFAYLDPLVANPMTAGAVVEELKRSLGGETWNLNSRLMLGYCYSRMGRGYLPLALGEYRLAAKIMPEGKDIRAKIEWIEKAMAAPPPGMFQGAEIRHQSMPR
ncbi:MAG: hypothetical protein WCP22_09295 [Chlamydiota bacterium]